MAPCTEIDTIFASKSSSTPVDAASSSKLQGRAKTKLSPLNTKKTKRKKKNDNTPEVNAFAPDANDLATTAKRKRAEPETILDPSAQGTSVKKTATPRGEESWNHAAKKAKMTLDEDKKFRDSRGKGPRVFSLGFWAR